MGKKIVYDTPIDLIPRYDSFGRPDCMGVYGASGSYIGPQEERKRIVIDLETEERNECVCGEADYFSPYRESISEKVERLLK